MEPSEDKSGFELSFDKAESDATPVVLFFALRRIASMRHLGLNAFPQLHARTSLRNLHHAAGDHIPFFVLGDVFIQPLGTSCFMPSRNCRFSVSTASTCALTSCPTFTLPADD